MKDYIIYDIETAKYAEDSSVGGWDHVYEMGMASCVTYDSKTDAYQFWDHLSRERLCDYLNGKILVSFNGIMFDSRVLLGNNRIITKEGITQGNPLTDHKEEYWWYNLDLYVEIFRILFKMDKSNYPKVIEAMKAKKHAKGIFGLKDITKATINKTKNGDGADAPMLFQQGRIVELFQYNLQDVRILKELLEFVQKYKYLVTGSYDIIQFK